MVPPRCGLCVMPEMSMVAVDNLKKKYYYPQIETYHFRTVSNFIYGTIRVTQIPIAAKLSRLLRCRR